MTPLSKDVSTDAATTNRLPLDEFIGDLVDIKDEVRYNENTKKDNTFIIFDFSNIDIIKANEPYNFPTFRMEVMELNFPNTGWEVLKASIRKCGFSGNLNNLIDKRLHVKWGVALLNLIKQGTGRGTNIPASYEVREDYCYQVVNIEGVEDTSNKLTEAVLVMIDGHDAADFKKSFMANSDIRQYTGYSDLMISVANNKLLETLVLKGDIVSDADGIYHRK